MTEAEQAIVYVELREVYSPQEANYWLANPHMRLDWRRPNDCKLDEVLAVIDQLKSGAFT